MLDSAELNQGTTEVPSEPSDDAPLASESGMDGQSLRTHVEREFDLAQIMRRSYRKDPLFAKIMTHPKAHPCFGIRDQLIWTKSQMGRDAVCIPWGAFLRGSVMTRSTPVPTPSLHPLGPGPIPDVSSDALHVASHHVTPSRRAPPHDACERVIGHAAHGGPCGFSYLPYRPPHCIKGPVEPRSKISLVIEYHRCVTLPTLHL